MSDLSATEAQFNKMIEFRQALYDHAFPKRRDAQFELLDALLSSAPVPSFPHLSQAPLVRRHWTSCYAALEDGTIDTTWLHAALVQHLPPAPVVLPLDSSAWPRPAAPTLPQRQYLHSPTPAVDGHSIVVGLAYSLFTWAPDPRSSWVLPLSIVPIPPDQDAVAVGVQQVQQFCQARPTSAQDLVVADSRYGGERFLRPLRDQPIGVLVRLRQDRVLYRAPGPYAGTGRRRVHGARFAFQDPSTWGDPTAAQTLEDGRWGTVRLRAWTDLHAKTAADLPMTVLLLEVHQERATPPAGVWVAAQGVELALEVLWRAYVRRWGIEPAIRFRKQVLGWTQPQCQSGAVAERWTTLVSLAQWQLYLARDGVTDRPLPWQAAQTTLTPGRVLRAMGGVLARLGSPVRIPKRRGTAPGWPQGRARTKPARYPIVKKGRAPPKRTDGAAQPGHGQG